MIVQLNVYWWLTSLAILALCGFAMGYACGRTDRKSKQQETQGDALSDAVIDRMLLAFHGEHPTNFHRVAWTLDQRRSMRAAIAAQAVNEENNDDL